MRMSESRLRPTHIFCPSAQPTVPLYPPRDTWLPYFDALAPELLREIQ